jgi:UDP:flavonoid glycosyltransferase YjiC (YdhE family)
VRLAVRKLLAEDRYARQAAALAAWAAEHDGACAAADAVESIVTARSQGYADRRGPR